MESQFARLGVKPIRFPASDGADISTAEQARLNPLNGRVFDLVPGEIGCFLSHMRIWERAANSAAPYCAIFEDDIRFSANAQEYLCDTSWVPQGVDFMKLDTSDQPGLFTDISLLTGKDRSVARLWSEMTCTSGYLLSRACARMLMEKLQVMKAPLDIQMFAPRYETFTDKAAWQIMPAICVQQYADTSERFLPQDAEVSDIAIARDKLSRTKPREKIAGWAKVQRNLARAPRRAMKKLRRRYGAWRVNGEWITVKFLP